MATCVYLILFKMEFPNRYNIQDRDLILRFQKNQDKECFEQLYDKYADIVYRKCLLYLENQENAQDATQEIWIRVYLPYHLLITGQNFQLGSTA